MYFHVNVAEDIISVILIDESSVSACACMFVSE